MAQDGPAAVLTQSTFPQEEITDGRTRARLLDQEDSSTQRRIMSSGESFRRWLGTLGDIISFIKNVYDLYVQIRRWLYGY